MTNCTFSGNTATDSGGGMYNYFASNPPVTNSTFSGNSAEQGGGMFNYDYSDPTVSNCTFSGNTATDSGGGMYNDSFSNPTVTNCILWGDEPNEIVDDAASTTTVTYSDVEGGTGESWFGTGCIDADPCFADAIGGDWHLRDFSPCVDAGDNDSVPADTADLDNDGNTTEPIPWDLDSRPRFADGDCNTTDIVDMGAYEFDWIYIGDFAGGCDVNFPDFSVLGLTWQKEEGQPGYKANCDISLPADGIIDEKDLKICTDNWLAGL